MYPIRQLRCAVHESLSCFFAEWLQGSCSGRILLAREPLQLVAERSRCPPAVSRQADHPQPEPWTQRYEYCKSHFEKAAFCIDESIRSRKFKFEFVGNRLDRREFDSSRFCRARHCRGLHVHG